MSVPSWPARSRALSPARRLLVVAAVVGLCDLLLYLPLVAVTSVVGGGPGDWAAPVAPLLGGFLGAVLGQGLLLSWRRRRAGEADRAARRPIETAARTGRLPAGVDPVVWAPLLAKGQQVQRRRTVVAVVAQAAVTVAAVTLVLVATDVAVLSVVLWLMVSGQVMSLVWTAGRRRERRPAGMIERLAARTAADQPAAGR